MIKPRRIGHATFETPDLQKAIDYYTQVMGLVLAEREKDRAFLATKIGLLGHRARTRAMSSAAAGCRSRSRPTPISARLPASSQRTASRASCATIRFPASGRCSPFTDNKGTTIELFKDWSYLGKHEQVTGIGPLKLGHVAFVVDGPAGDRRILREGARLQGLRLDRRFLRLHALQPDHHTVNFITRPTISRCTTWPSS